MWVLLFFVDNTSSSTLNSRMSTTTFVAPGAASVYFLNPLTHKKAYSVKPESRQFFLIKLVTDRAIAEINSANLRYTQPASMISMQYGNNL